MLVLSHMLTEFSRAVVKRVRLVRKGENNMRVTAMIKEISAEINVPTVVDSIPLPPGFGDTSGRDHP
jgi:hypothetical protein